MLPKTRRIERKNFSHILNTGKRSNSKSFTLYLSKIEPGSTVDHSKVAFSASKKVVKTAVGRNKCRRRGYSAIGKILNRIKPGYYLFFVYKKGFETNFHLLEAEIEALLSSSLVII